MDIGNEKPIDLGKFYDDVKAELGNDKPFHHHPHPGCQAECDKMMFVNCGKLKEGCGKHFLLDIYCKILPLDQDYIDGHQGEMKGDIDNMLASKGTTALQYMTACKESTKSPLLDYLIRSINGIGRTYMEDTQEAVNDAVANGADPGVAPLPDDPTENKEVNDQLVDVKTDPEYNTFIDELKQKTIKKIVNDVSKIINDKKSENSMGDINIPTQPMAAVESTDTTTSVGVNWLQAKLMKESVEATPEMFEQMLGMAIREATLNQFDVVFRQPRSDVKSFASNIRFNKGVVVNESAVHYLVEAAGDIANTNAGSPKKDEKKTPEEVEGVVDEANAEAKDKINSKLTATDVLGANEDKKGEKK